MRFLIHLSILNVWPFMTYIHSFIDLVHSQIFFLTFAHGIFHVSIIILISFSVSATIGGVGTSLSLDEFLLNVFPIF